MTIVIRSAREDELQAAARVLRDAFAQYREPVGVTVAHRDELARYLRDVADVRSRVGAAELFVAVHAGRILGAATLYRPDRQPSYDTGAPGKPWPLAWASLRLLGVDPAHRGRGLGRMLAEARIRRASALGAPVVAMHTTRAFEVARAMYRRMGWQRAPEYDFWPVPEICAEGYMMPLAGQAAITPSCTSASRS